MNFVLTEPWDSENYNVFINGKQIGKICLKDGYLKVYFHDQVIYEAYPFGYNSFDYHERDQYLNIAKDLFYSQKNMRV
jgi:hypothetical protein